MRTTSGECSMCPRKRQRCSPCDARGPQTVGELRINSERLHRFADISSVERSAGAAARPAGALVVELPRQAGSREPRWAQLLSGKPAIQ